MYDVIIAGAGPVGLFLACELRLAKLSVLVLEQLATPSSPLKRMPFGMRGLWGPSLEAFYRRGLLDKLEPQFGGPVAKGASRTSGPAGHFAGLQFDRANIDTARWPYRLPSPADSQMMSTMEELERVLSTHALAQGVEIRRGTGVETLATTADDVTVNGGVQTRWLVGCDGGRSTVRKLAGFDFVGTEPEFTGYSLDLELAEPDLLPIGRHHTPTGSWTQWNRGAFAISDFDGGEGHRKPVTVDNVQAMLRRITGTDVTVTGIKVASTWTDRSKQTTTYRNGRVLLAGDAAHIHSPFGGQGVNLGLGDAMNLGWKLAATIRGKAADGLLDTYTVERHPIGARILEWTRAQVASMRPDPVTRALQGVLRDIINTRDGATYFAERVWGVNNRYDLGDPHPLVGRSCPDFEMVDGTKLGTLLRDGRSVLLDFDRNLAPVAGFAHIASDAKNRLGVTAVLVRPDGIVAWATETSPKLDEVRHAAARWFATA